MAGGDDGESADGLFDDSPTGEAAQAPEPVAEPPAEEPKPKPRRKSKSKKKLAAKPPVVVPSGSDGVVAPGKAISCRKGVVGEGRAISVADIHKDPDVAAANFAKLVARGLILKG